MGLFCVCTLPLNENLTRGKKNPRLNAKNEIAVVEMPGDSLQCKTTRLLLLIFLNGGSFDAVCAVIDSLGFFLALRVFFFVFGSASSYLHGRVGLTQVVDKPKGGFLAI